MSNFHFVSHDKDGEIISQGPYQFPDLLTAIEVAKSELNEMGADGVPLESNSSVAIEIQNDDYKPIVNLRLHFTIDFIQPQPVVSTPA